MDQEKLRIRTLFTVRGITAPKEYKKNQACHFKINKDSNSYTVFRTMSNIYNGLILRQ